MEPLIRSSDVDLLRTALSDYTPDAVNDAVGLRGELAFARGDLAEVGRALPTSGNDAGEPLHALIRLFMLGGEVPEQIARRALAPYPLEAGLDAGLLEIEHGRVSATLDLRPYGELDGPLWWVLSDFGSDVRPGPVSADHVLGIGPASLTLAQATVRRPVRQALDIGSGCGIQALHLGRHAAHVTATDVSERALRLAATTAALNGLEWELLEGSLLEPVAERRFDLIVANPPFVISPGWRAGEGFDYRDSGLVGDEVCRRLVSGAAAHLNPDGTAQLLANWVITAEQSWEERLSGWVAAGDCSAWIWRRESMDCSAYAALWLRDAGEQPGSARWLARYDSWMEWFERSGVLGIGMGLITLRRVSGAPFVVCEDVTQAVEQPCGTEIDAWFTRQTWLRDTTDSELLVGILRAGEDCLLSTESQASSAGWHEIGRRLRQTSGMHWELDIDEAMSAVVGACDGQRQLGTAVAVLSAGLGADVTDVARAVVPVVRDLVQRGFLLPV